MQTENWDRINKALQDVLEVEPSKRKEYLEQANLDDDVLKEVESLLGFEEEAAAAFNLSAVEFSKDFVDDDDSESPIIGQEFGVYKVVRELGFGGMGSVYLAERIDGKFKQKVALKLLKREMNTSTLRRRFEQERDILASLEHPNIARLLDAGTTEDKIPFIAMEYIEGSPIDEYCQEQNLSLNERLDLFRKVCLAVNFAHRNLVVHRDLKPSNILVTKDGTPKLLDFGISKIINREFESVNLATVTKMGVMTPSYASPEQLRGKSVTTATDIYSLGVILYELLSGQRPFQAEEGDISKIQLAVLEDDPPLPSFLMESVSEKLKQLSDSKTIVEEFENPGLGEATVPLEDVTKRNVLQETRPQRIQIKPQYLKGDLDNIILKSLQKEPERRYSSAENFSEDIRRHQEGKPVTARPDKFSYRAGKFIKRNRLGVIAGSLILLVIIAGIMATLWQARIAQEERIKAEKRFNDVRSLANSFLFEITPEIENLNGSTRAKELLVKRALEYLDSLASEAGNDPVLQRELAAAYEKVGDVQGNPFQANIGDMKGAIESYEKARIIRQNLFENNPEDIDLKSELAINSQLSGDVFYTTGDIQKASERYQQALDLQKEVLTRRPSDSKSKQNVAAAYYALGTTYFWNSKLDEAIENYTSAREILNSLSLAQPQDEIIKDKLANTFIRIGETQAWQSNLKDSEQNILKGLNMIKPIAEKNPNNANFRNSLWTANVKAGEVYLDLEKFDKSLEHYQKALELAKAAAASDPNNVTAKYNLAMSFNKVSDALDSSGNGKEALTHAEQALTLQKAISAADSKNFGILHQMANTYKRMGYAYTTMQDLQGARTSYENALGQYEKLSKIDPNDQKLPRDIAIVSQTIGQTYLDEAKKSNKKENLQKGLGWIEKSLKLLLELKTKGSLAEFDNKLISEIEAQVAETKAAISKS
jgi:serine/threonine protein kinase